MVDVTVVIGVANRRRCRSLQDWTDNLRVLVAVIKASKRPLEKMHTHTFGLNDVDLAVRTLAGRVEGQNAIHVMVVPKF